MNKVGCNECYEYSDEDHLYCGYCGAPLDPSTPLYVPSEEEDRTGTKYNASLSFDTSLDGVMFGDQFFVFPRKFKYKFFQKIGRMKKHIGTRMEGM